MAPSYAYVCRSTETIKLDFISFHILRYRTWYIKPKTHISNLLTLFNPCWRAICAKLLFLFLVTIFPLADWIMPFSWLEIGVSNCFSIFLFREVMWLCTDWLSYPHHGALSSLLLGYEFSLNMPVYDNSCTLQVPDDFNILNKYADLCACR